MTKGKYLCLDYGEKRVGIALSDFDKALVFPRDPIVYKTPAGLRESLSALCRAEQVVKIIIGLPLAMDGAWGEKAKKVIVFGEKLKTLLPGIAIEYFDERLTTMGSAKTLRAAGVKAKRQKGMIDSVSAHLILTTYLKSLKG
ncbi:Holliday junction resolvase RuvX [Candidatus Peregrinibacteria bacterium]|nr:Holliday junction resolvase RuvX [Candidatus Peregrinibacteria bacterium]